LASNQYAFQRYAQSLARGEGPDFAAARSQETKAFPAGKKEGARRFT
jgi:hypothetical protein